MSGKIETSRKCRINDKRNNKNNKNNKNSEGSLTSLRNCRGKNSIVGILKDYPDMPLANLCIADNDVLNCGLAGQFAIYGRYTYVHLNHK